jgi:hypothetical protein
VFPGDFAAEAGNHRIEVAEAGGFVCFNRQTRLLPVFRRACSKTNRVLE